MNTVNDTQVGGLHYRSSYQHWDFARLCLDNRYYEGCVTKYVARWRKKNGVQDLEKALHYLDKITELFIAEQYEPLVQNLPDKLLSPGLMPLDFCKINGLGEVETRVVCGLTHWNNAYTLHSIREHILELLAEAKGIERRQQAIKAGAFIPRDNVADLGAKAYQPSADDHGDEPGPGYVGQG